MAKANANRDDGLSQAAPILGPSRRLLSVNDAADLLNVAPLTVRRLLDRGLLGSLKVGRVIRIPHGELERYVTDRLTRCAGGGAERPA